MALERGARREWAAIYPHAFGLSQLPVALAPTGDVWGAESECWGGPPPAARPRACRSFWKPTTADERDSQTSPAPKCVANAQSAPGPRSPEFDGPARLANAARRKRLRIELPQATAQHGSRVTRNLRCRLQASPLGRADGASSKQTPPPLIELPAHVVPAATNRMYVDHAPRQTRES